MKDIDTAIVGPNVMTSCGLLIGGKPCPLPPWHAGPPIHTEDLTPGTIFDTPFEQGCEVITEPDEQGRFDAYDSERVVCSFCTVMVVGHPDSTAAPVSA